MMIGDRLRELRSHKKLSQGDIEKRTGLLRCYLSRVENGHTVPTIETLEKIARALEVPMYQLFYGYEEAPDMFLLLARTFAHRLLAAAEIFALASGDRTRFDRGPERSRAKLPMLASQF